MRREEEGVRREEEGKKGGGGRREKEGLGLVEDGGDGGWDLFLLVMHVCHKCQQLWRGEGGRCLFLLVMHVPQIPAAVQGSPQMEIPVWCLNTTSKKLWSFVIVLTTSKEVRVFGPLWSGFAALSSFGKNPAVLYLDITHKHEWAMHVQNLIDQARNG